MAQLAKEIEELQDEKNKISIASAGFAVFLKENAITPFNDSIDQYLQSMIEQRKMVGQLKEMNELEKLRRQYAAEKELYEKNLAMSFSNSLFPSPTRKKLRPEDVRTVLDELNKLPRSGPWSRLPAGSNLQQDLNVQAVVEDTFIRGSLADPQPHGLRISPRGTRFHMTSAFSISGKRVDPAKSRKATLFHEAPSGDLPDVEHFLEG